MIIIKACLGFLAALVLIVPVAFEGGPASAAAPAPALRALSSTAAAVGGGERIVVRGSGFEHVAAVVFGSATGIAVRTYTSSTLTVSVPAHAAGTVDVRVVVHRGAGHATSAAVRADRFTYYARPVLTSTDVTSGTTSGGAPITIHGRGFTPSSLAYFSSTPAARMRYVSSTAVRAQVPVHAAGTVYLYVRDEFGTSAQTGAVRFTFLAPPPPCPTTPIHVGGAITADTTWSVGACGLTYVLDSDVTVDAGVTLTVDAGTTVRGVAGAALRVSGALVTSGTAASPVTFTAVSPGATSGYWAGIVVSGGARADLQGVELSYASTALSVIDDDQTSADVIVRGRIVNSGMGVDSDNSVVDARYVDWGDPSGPSPVGDGTPIAGQGVFLTPWIGYVTPGRPSAAAPSTAEAGLATCADVLFIGARGSGEGPQGSAVDDPDTSDQALLGDRLPPVLTAMSSRLADLSAPASAPTVRVLGLRYAASPPPYAAFSTPSQGYLDSIYDGVDELKHVLSLEHGYCPDEKIVLAGYSQGALVVHLVLDELDQSGQLAQYPVSAVELVADPARTGDGIETRLGDAPTTSQGLWSIKRPDLPGELPASLIGRTTTICHLNDAVCDAAREQPDGSYPLNPDGRGEPHASYPIGGELDPLGEAAAQAVHTDLG